MLDESIRKAMAKHLEEAGLLTPVLDPDHAIHQVSEALGKQFEDKIAIIWSVGDIRSDDHNSWITNEEAVGILEEMDHRHDAELGITWATVEFYTDELKRSLGKEELSKRQGDTNES